MENILSIILISRNHWGAISRCVELCVGTGGGGGGGGGAGSTGSGAGESRTSLSPSGEKGPNGYLDRDRDRAAYLQQLIKDQKTCLAYPNVFSHVERLLSEGRSKN